MVVDGRPTTLGADLFASGTVDCQAPPGSTREAAVEGYDVAMTPENVPVNEGVTL